MRLGVCSWLSAPLTADGQNGALERLKEENLTSLMVDADGESAWLYSEAIWAVFQANETLQLL